MCIRRMLPLIAGAAVLLASARAQQKNPPTPPSGYTGLFSLVRYDLPVGRSDGYAPTRQLAERRGGENAVDWPDLTFNGVPIFRNGAEEKIVLNLRAGAAASSFFQVKEDDKIEPGNHWLRPMEWRGGRRHIYTADKNGAHGECQ